MFDTLFRLLQRTYPKVTYVRNITDVDDKIMDAAKTKGIAIDEVTRTTTRLFHEDMAALNALPPTVEPRATDHIAQMIAMIEKLIASGHAYVNEGHALFNVPSMLEYGRLSNRDRKEMIAGARVEVAPYKKDAADFVLWIARGAVAVRAGISNVPPCRKRISARPSTSMAAASIWCFRTMRTRSPSRSAPTAASPS